MFSYWCIWLVLVEKYIVPIL